MSTALPATASPAPPGHNVLAWASIVFALLGLSFLPVLGSLVSIVCGHVACAQIRRRPYASNARSVALAGLWMGWGGLIVLVALIAWVFFWLIPAGLDFMQWVFNGAGGRLGR